jgi:ubiquinone biosynthesis monooxygenase Coq7
MTEINGFDIDIIRPEVHHDSVKVNRGEGMTKERLTKIHEALLAFHNLENMAANIYRFQLCENNGDVLNREIIAAMLNEMGHIEDFQVKLYEFGFKPSIMMYAYQVVGFVFGIYSRLQGEAGIRKMGVWVESKAVSHYDELLESVEWDEDTRKVIEKDQADEYGHIRRWKGEL